MAGWRNPFAPRQARGQHHATARRVARPPRRLAHAERGNLLLLAGIILTLGAIATAITLMQLDVIEKQGAQEHHLPITEEWRFAREQLKATMQQSTAVSTTNETFRANFELTSSSIKQILASRGYQVIIELAAGGHGLNATEWNLTYAGDRFSPLGQQPQMEWYGSSAYSNYSADGRLSLVGIPYDGSNDGLAWTNSCQQEPSASCIQAFYVYLYVTDGASSLEETILFPVNTGTRPTYNPYAPAPPGSFFASPAQDGVAVEWRYSTPTQGVTAVTYELARSGLTAELRRNGNPYTLTCPDAQAPTAASLRDPVTDLAGFKADMLAAGCIAPGVVDDVTFVLTCDPSYAVLKRLTGTISYFDESAPAYVPVLRQHDPMPWGYCYRITPISPAGTVGAPQIKQAYFGPKGDGWARQNWESVGAPGLQLKGIARFDATQGGSLTDLRWVTPPKWDGRIPLFAIYRAGPDDPNTSADDTCESFSGPSATPIAYGTGRKWIDANVVVPQTYRYTLRPLVPAPQGQAADPAATLTVDGVTYVPGRCSSISTLQAVGRPPPPAAVTAALGEGVVQLTWQVTGDGGASLLGFLINRTEILDGAVNYTYNTSYIVGPQERGYNDSIVQTGRTYKYTVLAVNQAGSSAPADAAETVTIPLPPAMVGGLNVVAPDPGANTTPRLRLKWTADCDNEATTHVLVYHVYRASGGPYTSAGTAPPYTYRGSIGNTASACQSSGGGQITRTWTDEASAANAITPGKRYYYAISAVSHWGRSALVNASEPDCQSGWTCYANATARGVPRMAGDAFYKIEPAFRELRLLWRNATDHGEPAANVTYVVKRALGVTDLQWTEVVTCDDTKCPLVWRDVPDATGTLQRQYFRSYRDWGNTTDASPNPEPSLVNGQSYTYHIVAKNAWTPTAGTPSRSLTERPNQIPNMPEATTAPTVHQTVKRVDLTWTIPTNVQPGTGATVDEYKIYRVLGENAPLAAGAKPFGTSLGTQLNFSDASPPAGSKLTYYVSACNNVGCSGNRSFSTATTPLPPTSETTITLQALTTESTMVVSWTVPTATSNATGWPYAPTIGHDVHYKAPLSTTYTRIQQGAATATYRHTAVTGQGMHTYAIAHVSAWGTSPLSESASARAPWVPVRPGNVTATSTVAAKEVVVTWTADTNASSTTASAESYAVYRATGAGAATKQGEVTTPTYRDTAVSAQTTYTYHIVALSGWGDSAASATASNLTPSLPRTPASVVVKASNATQAINLAWQADPNPPETHRASVTQYGIYRSGPDPAPGSPRTLLVVLPVANASADSSSAILPPSFADKGADTDTIYEYTVAADSVWGQSPPMAPLSASLSIPERVVVAAKAGQNYVNLTWTRENLGKTLTHAGRDFYAFKVYRATGNGPYVEITSLTDRRLYNNLTAAADGKAWFNDSGISNVTNGVSYKYYVTVVDCWVVSNACQSAAYEGRASNRVEAVPGDVPSRPLNLLATAKPRVIELSWDAPTITYGYPIVNYHLYRNNSGNAMVRLATVTTNRTFQDFNVAPGGTYTYSVAAVTQIGAGPNSTQAIAIAPNAPSASTTSPQATASLTERKVTITWTPPADPTAAPITQFRVYRFVQGESRDLTAVVACTSGAGTVKCDDTTALAGTTYIYYMTAVNGVGEGPRSPDATPFNTPQDPNIPSNLHATASDSARSISLTWVAPTAGQLEPGVIDYLIYRDNATGTLSPLKRVGSQATTFTDTDVRGGVAYKYGVAAISPWGESDPTQPSSIARLRAADAPTVTVTSSTQQITLTWTIPATFDTRTVTSYNIYRAEGSGTMALYRSGITSTTFVDKNQVEGVASNISNGVTYKYRVAAVDNATVEGFLSTTVQGAASGAPDAPTIAVTASAGKLTISWNVPNDRGSPLLNYIIKRNASGSGPVVTANDMVNLATVSATNTSFDDLTPKHNLSYSYAIVAKNAIGNSALSEIKSAIMPGVPGAPPAPQAAIQPIAASRYVYLTWGAGVSPQNAPITSYVLQRDDHNGSMRDLATIPAPGVAYSDTDVQPGKLYHYRLIAVNGVGRGVPSANTSFTTPVAPDKPAGVVATRSESAYSITISWTAPASNGGNGVTLKDYLVHRRVNGTNTWTNSSVSYLTPTTTQTGLTPGVKYDYRVTARSHWGNSSFDTAFQSSARVLNSPPAPQSVTAAGTDGVIRIAVAWAPPPTYTPDDPRYYGAIQNYKVYRMSANNDGTWPSQCPLGAGSTTVQTTSHTDSNSMTYGNRFRYCVVAHTAAGDGNASAPVEGRVYDAPSAPTWGSTPVTVTTVPAVGSTVTVRWNAPAAPADSPPQPGNQKTSYKVNYWRVDAQGNTIQGSENTVGGVQSEVWTSGTLASGTWKFRVAGVNGANAGGLRPDNWSTVQSAVIP